MATKLILIRHAQTNWNLEKRYSGFMDIGLNQKGVRQAKKLHKRLKINEIYEVYSSDRKRAVQTAQIAFKGSKIKRLASLREMHFGIFEGLTYKELMKSHPAIYKKWLGNPFRVRIPKGEDLGYFKKRVINTFKNIIAHKKNRTVAVVSHGGAISIFISSILKSKDFLRHIPKSASISIVEYRNNKPKINLFSDISHLNG